VVVALASNAGSVAASGGDNQTVPAGTVFQPLQAIVRDAAANPLAGVAVTFSALRGGSGANGAFASSSPVLTDTNGIATASTLTANGVAGGFSVTASAAGLASLASFNAAIAPIAAPTNVLATASTSTSVSVTWSASTGATSYEVVRLGAGGVITSLGTTAIPEFTDTLAAADAAYLYKVRVIAPSASDYSAVDLATTTALTDPVLTGLAVRAAHFTEVRSAVNAVRALAGLDAYSFTDPALSSGIVIKADHLIELRAALDAARALLLLPALTYARPTITAGSSMIAATDLYELREGIR
jgi:hypothetical protein